MLIKKGLSMNYIIHHLSFVLNDTQHRYFFLREDFSNYILSSDVLGVLCQYITNLTNTPTPSLTPDLNLDTVMSILNSYNIPISYGLATDFTNSQSGWFNEPYIPSSKEEKDIENG